LMVIDDGFRMVLWGSSTVRSLYFDNLCFETQVSVGKQGKAMIIQYTEDRVSFFSSSTFPLFRFQNPTSKGVLINPLMGSNSAIF
jgi:hypothetical protein